LSTNEFEKFWAEQSQRRAKVASMAGGRKPKTFNKAPTEQNKRRPAWAIRRSDYMKPGSEQVLPMDVPTRVRVVPFKNETYYHYMNCWIQKDGRYEMIISNSHNGLKKVPDVPYYYAIKEENEAFWARDTHAVTVLVLENFYKVMHTAANGKQYPKFVRSLGEDMRGNSLDPEDIRGNEMAFGRKLHWTASRPQKKIFDDGIARIKETCASCKEGIISTYAYGCSECGGTIASHKEGGIPESLESSLRSGPMECPHCGESRKAKEIVECVKRDGYGSTARWAKGCDNPKVVNLEEVDLIVRSIPSGKGAALEIIDFLPALEDERIKSWMTTPFDMEYLFGAMSLEDQARSMGKANPFGVDEQRIVDNMFIAKPEEEDEFSIPVDDDDDIGF